jgi:putative endopeptidase
VKRQSRIALVLAVVGLAACSQEGSSVSSTAASIERAAPLRSGIALEHMDMTVNPGDDFFSYVNGAWVANTEIPPDQIAYGTFRIIQDKTEEDVRAIIEASMSGDFAMGTDHQKVGALYRSFMDMKTRNRKGLEPLRPELQVISAVEDYDDLARYFARAGRYGTSVPMDIRQLEDWNDPTRYSMVVTQGGLGLPDREYYFNTDDTTIAQREKYVKHIEKMFELAGMQDGAAAAEAIMALETRLAEHNMEKEQARERAKNYKSFERAQLGEIMPRFNWNLYLEEYGVPGIDSLILYMPDYLKALDEIIVSTDIDTWKTYLSWVALNSAAALLNEELDAQNFEFYGKTLTGREEQQPMWRRGVNIVNGALGEVVGKAYVARHFPPEAKERMLVLVGNLLTAYEQSITELDWMGDATKAEALEKLSKFVPKVGYPDKWRDYSALEIIADDLLGNLQRAALAEHKRDIDRHDSPVDRSDWFITPQTVNAGYSPSRNEIVFPAAILQPPFFDLEADEAVNYGAIGAGIGHEIGHGFDDQGSAFDGEGALRNWWTDQDRDEFERRTDRLVAQYDSYRPFDDLAVNGEFTQGENIGDLGGLSIGLLAYKLSLNGDEAPVIDGFTGMQRVFLGYGQLWRQKYRDEALRQLIQTNPHAPSMYRANGAVRNVPEFYEAFDVQEGDALYLPPEERVKIW